MFRTSLLPGFALVLLLAIWVAVFYQLRTERTAAHNEAVAHAESLAHTLSEHVGHILRQTDHATQLFKLKYEETNGKLRLAEFTRQGGLLDSVLPSKLDLPIALVDASGKVLDSEHAYMPANVRDEPYFAALAGASNDATIYTTPITEQKTRKWQIQVARRLNDNNGNFAGALLILIDPAYFVDDYDRLNIDDSGMLVLMGRDAGLATGRMGDQIFTSDQIDFTPPQEPGHPLAELEIRKPLDTVPRIYSFHDLPRYSLVAIVGVTEEIAMERYSRHRMVYLALTNAASLLIIVIVAALMRQSERLRESMCEAREAQATLRAAADGSLDGFIVLKPIYDPQGTIGDFAIIDINERMAQLTRTPRALLLGKPAFATLPRYQGTGVFERYRQVANSGLPLEGEWELLVPGEPPRWIQQQIVPIGGGGIAVTSRDITQRHAQEQALRESEAALAAMANASPLGLVRTDLEGNCSYVNRMFEVITGMHRDAALGQGWMQAVHPDDRSQIGDAFDHQRTSLEPFRHDMRCLLPDGRVVRTAVKIAAIRIDDRIEGFVGTVEDVTALREAEAALRESESRLRTIADTLPAMVAYIDSNEVYRFHNIAYDREFGSIHTEVPGRTILETVGPERYERLKPYIDRALHGETLMFEESDEREGFERTLEVTYIPQVGADGETVVGFHVMRQDITSQNREKKRLLKLAHVDSLTGLTNRAGFMQKLEEAMRTAAVEQRLMAVMFMDIDRFKPVNDTYGHNVGDALLKAFSQRLTHALRATDTVARLGGDEFTIIMEKIHKPEDASAIAAKIVSAMQRPFSLDGVLVSISTSIGLSFYRDQDLSAEALLKQADDLLYKAKQAGRNTYRVAA